MSDSLCYFDSNVWLYRLITDLDANDAEEIRKHNIATNLTDVNNVVISTQVINEVCAVLLKKANFSENQIREVIQEFCDGCIVVGINRSTMTSASELRSRYSFSFWDSLIITSALEAGVSTLYSEDMQDGLIVSKQIEIVNPFK